MSFAGSLSEMWCDLGMIAGAYCAVSGRRADDRGGRNNLCIVSDDADGMMEQALLYTISTWTKEDNNNKQINEGIS